MWKSESILLYVPLGVTILTICSSWGDNIDNIVTPMKDKNTEKLLCLQFFKKKFGSSDQGSNLQPLACLTVMLTITPWMLDGKAISFFCFMNLHNICLCICTVNQIWELHSEKQDLFSLCFLGLYLVFC